MERLDLCRSASVSPGLQYFMCRASEFRWAGAPRGFATTAITERDDIVTIEGTSYGVGVVVRSPRLMTLTRLLLRAPSSATEEASSSTQLAREVLHQGKSFLQDDRKLQPWQQWYIDQVFEAHSWLLQVDGWRCFIDLANLMVDIHGNQCSEPMCQVWCTHPPPGTQAALPLFALPGAGKTLVYLLVALLLTKEWSCRCLIVAPPGVTSVVLAEVRAHLAPSHASSCRLVRMMEPETRLLTLLETVSLIVVTPTTAARISASLWRALKIKIVVWDEAQQTLPTPPPMCSRVSSLRPVRTDGLPFLAPMSSEEGPEPWSMLHFIVSGTHESIAAKNLMFMGLGVPRSQLLQMTQEASIGAVLPKPQIYLEILPTRLQALERCLYATLLRRTPTAARALLNSEVAVRADMEVSPEGRRRGDLLHDAMTHFCNQQLLAWQQTARYWQLAAQVMELPPSHTLRRRWDAWTRQWTQVERDALSRCVGRWSTLPASCREGVQTLSLVLDAGNLQHLHKERQHLLVCSLGETRLAKDWCWTALLGQNPAPLLRDPMYAHEVHCVICWETLPTLAPETQAIGVFQPCMHGLFCAACTRRLSQGSRHVCPLDRQEGTCITLQDLQNHGAALMQRQSVSTSNPEHAWEACLGPKLRGIVAHVLQRHHARGPHHVALVVRSNGARRLQLAFEEAAVGWTDTHHAPFPLELCVLSGNSWARARQLQNWHVAPTERGASGILVLVTHNNCQEISGLNLQPKDGASEVTVYLLSVPIEQSSLTASSSSSTIEANEEDEVYQTNALLQTLGRFKRPGQGTVGVFLVLCEDTPEWDARERHLAQLSTVLSRL